MVQLLVADFVRRCRRRALWFAAFAVVMLWANVQLGEPSRVFAVSIGCALGLGPLLLLRWVPRAVWYLPVSRRDIWRASWLFTTLGTTLALLGLKFVTMLLLPVTPSLDLQGVSPVLSFSTVWLSTVFDVAAAGIGCMLVIIATLPPGRSTTSHRLGAIARNAADAVLQVAFFAIWFGAARLIGWLPTRWSDFTATTALVLAAAVIVTVATYFHTPTPLALARQQPPPSVERQPAATRPRSAGGLSGLPRLLAHEYWVALATAGALFAVSLLVVIVMGNMLQSPQAIADLFRDELQFMDSGVPASPEPPVGPHAVLALIWYAFFVATLVARFPSMLRHLRVLPIGTRQLNALLVGWPALFWVTAAAALSVMRFLVLGEGPRPEHLPVFIALTGLSAIAGAVTLLVPGVRRAFALAIVLGLSPLLHLIAVPQSAYFAWFGATALIAAATINHLTLRRGATYRIRPPELAASSRYVA